jgi:phage shock protein A
MRGLSVRPVIYRLMLHEGSTGVGLLSRFTTYIKSLISGFLDRAEDPGMVLDYSYEQQLEQLQNLRRSLADVVTNEKRLELQEAQIQQQMQKLDGQAREAVAANREDLARLALERKQGLQQYITSYDQQIQQLKAQQQKFVEMEQRLSARVESFRAQKEMVKAQYGAAQAQVKIQEAATGISEEMADVNLAVQRAQDKVLQMQARANAMDELIQSGSLQEIGAGPQDDLDRQLAAISQGSDQAAVDRELAALKAQQSLPAPAQPASPQLPAASSTPAQQGDQ